jgi:cholest-4-en-3-one 26-monooxygenase
MTPTATAADVDLESIDLMDQSWFADGPPHELFARMRAEAPIRWNERANGQSFWSCTKHEHVSAISRDTQTFSSYEQGIFLQPDQVMPLDLLRNVLLYKDPPEHTKYRLILQKAFTPNTVRQLEDAVRRRVTRILDEVIERGECDFVEDVAVQLPLQMLAELMGIPDADVPQLYEWTEDIERAQQSPEGAAATETFVAMSMYLHGQIERQVAEGVEDSLVTKLKAAEVDGQYLEDAEILTFFGLLVFAGNDTTRNTASSGLHALLSHRDQWDLLKEDLDRVELACEEILRWTSVVQWFVRTATTDTELGDQPIAKGDKVVMWYSSASRDEDVYDDPQTFDILRAEHAHKAFGGGGRHFCLGAGLARLELRILLEELARRTPDIELAGDPVRLQSNWANSLTSLPVRFTPGARES